MISDFELACEQVMKDLEFIKRGIIPLSWEVSGDDSQEFVEQLRRHPIVKADDVALAFETIGFTYWDKGKMDNPCDTYKSNYDFDEFIDAVVTFASSRLKNWRTPRLF